MRYNNICFTLKNSKLGGFIPSIDLPPIITCRKNAPCRKGCYALKGNFRYSTKIKSMADNLNEYKVDSQKFFNSIAEFLNNGDILYRFFRWFGAGDIVDEKFFEGVVDVANRCPQTKFLMFTKKYEIVNEYLDKNEKLPDNLHIVFSMWDKTFKVENPHNLPKAYVNFKDKTCNPEIPEFAIPCTGDCSTCKSCWSLVKNQSVYFNQH